LPNQFRLSQNYPNPFNGQTIIEFTLPSIQNISLAVYDILGRKVETLAEGEYPIGNYKFTWSPKGLSSGVYIYRLQTGSSAQAKKMVLIK
jgi:hypothetical protein